MRVPGALLLLLAAGLSAAGPADTARAIREISLDPMECWRVRDLMLAREDLRVYFNDGYLVFAHPVQGRRVAAVFTAEAEGDAELLLMPPNRGERRSLASYTGSPNLHERFGMAVMVFSDDAYETLVGQIRANPFNRSAPEMGALAADRWSQVARNIAASFETRLALDLISGAPPAEGFFAAAVSGRKLGNFDVVFDPRGIEQIVAGQLASRDGRTWFDVWTSFDARAWRTGSRRRPSDFLVRDYRIEATLEPDLDLSAVVRLKVDPGAEARRVLAFDLAREMRVTSVAVDGRPAEVLQRESMRSNLVRNTGNDLILVAPPEPLLPGRVYELEFHERGKVVHDAGNNVYYVGARGNWYPNRFMQFATYDITFRHPRDLDLVTPGRIAEEKTEGEWRVTRRKTETPIRLAGFNLGQYESVRATRGGYSVEVYANRVFERELQPRAVDKVVVLPPASGPPRQRRPEILVLPAEAPIGEPQARLDELASGVAAALEFMAGRFGPPALDHLAVSPVPGAFGQGFPGLIYLSTMAYLTPQLRAARGMDAHQQLFFSEILHAHETAHQWWGNVVGPAGYHDDWLMEALANYSALLFLEKQKGARPVEMALEEYRTALLAKTESGETVDAVGPVVLGPRLQTSLAPSAWRTIIYGKGSWILHMLRRQMGDGPFLKMLGELRRRHEFGSVRTEQFRQLAARYLPPKWADPRLEIFFDEWVYGTGIPLLELDYAVKGSGRSLRVEGTVRQSEVDKDFSAAVPVEIQFARGKPHVHWVHTGPEPTAFRVPLRQKPVKVVLDPGRSVLRR